MPDLPSLILVLGPGAVATIAGVIVLLSRRRARQRAAARERGDQAHEDDALF